MERINVGFENGSLLGFGIKGLANFAEGSEGNVQQADSLVFEAMLFCF